MHRYIFVLLFIYTPVVLHPDITRKCISQYWGQTDEFIIKYPLFFP